jgi:hypothetical protein
MNTTVVLKALEAEKSRLSSELAQVNEAIRALKVPDGKVVPIAKQKRKRRKAMSAAAKAALSKRMKAFWAAKKAS